MIERWGKLFTLQSPGFPDKVINDPNFLHLLAVHLLDLADQDFTDKPVQYGLVQFLNGCIAPDFLDKGANFAFLCVRPALHHRQIVQALLVGFLLLFQRRRQLHKPLFGQDAFGFIRVQAQKHPVNFLIPGFQPFPFLLCLRSVHQIPALHPAAELLVERIGVLHGLSKSALGKYETDDYKDISPFAIATLADFYGVSTDYLMGLTENKNHPNTELQSLHLSDDMVELLSSGTEMLIHEFCDKLQIPFEKISSEDFSAFLRILSLSKQLKSPNKEKLLKPDFGQKKRSLRFSERF